MITKLELTIAFRYLRSKRKDGFISVVSMFSFLGIMLGVATLIIVMSVMKGFHVELLHNILGIQGHVTVHNMVTKKIDDYEMLIGKIKSIKGVEDAAPIILGEGLAVSDTKHSQGVIIRGMEPADFANKPLVKEEVPLETLGIFQEEDGILIGSVLAHKLRAAPGDRVKIFIPENSMTILGMIPRSKSYKVVGVFDLGLYQYNATTIFMPLSDAKRFFNFGDAVSEIEIMVKNPEDLSYTKQEIADLIGRNFSIIDWQHYNDSFLNSLAVERVVMFMILTLIVIVAAFNIISGLVMLVKDKTKNIAILRTMGMTSNSVVKIFILCGSAIGVIGTITGALLGIVVSLYLEKIRQGLESLTGIKFFDPVIYYLSKLPAVLEPQSVIGIVLMSIAFSVIATIYPSYRASKLMPTEVLRYE